MFDDIQSFTTKIVSKLEVHETGDFCGHSFALETYLGISVFVNRSMSNKINQQTMEKSNFSLCHRYCVDVSCRLKNSRYNSATREKIIMVEIDNSINDNYSEILINTQVLYHFEMSAIL